MRSPMVLANCARDDELECLRLFSIAGGYLLGVLDVLSLKFGWCWRSYHSLGFHHDGSWERRVRIFTSESASTSGNSGGSTML